MYITRKEELDTGGNIVIDFFHIEGGGDLKGVGISEDCIVGYNVEDFFTADETNELWYVNYDEPLRLKDYLPTDIRAELLPTLIERWADC